MKMEWTETEKIFMLKRFTLKSSLVLLVSNSFYKNLKNLNTKTTLSKSIGQLVDFFKIKSKMFVHIRTLPGKQFVVNIEPLVTTIGTIKCMLFEAEGISTPFQRIIFRGCELSDDDTLEKRGIIAGDVLFLVFRTPEEVEKLFQ